jgi:phosphoribosylamine--glycine ligase
VAVFHAGTRQRGAEVVTSGGRVLTVCAHAASFARARALAYEAVAGVGFEGCHFRGDIGAKAP